MRRYVANGGDRRDHPPLNFNFQPNGYMNNSSFSNASQQHPYDGVRFTGDHEADLAQFSNSGVTVPQPGPPANPSYIVEDGGFNSQRYVENDWNAVSYEDTPTAFFDGVHHANEPSSSRLPVVPTAPPTHTMRAPIRPRYPIISHPPASLGSETLWAPYMQRHDAQHFNQPPFLVYQPQPPIYPSTVETFTRATYPPSGPVPNEVQINSTPHNNSRFHAQSFRPGQVDSRNHSTGSDMLSTNNTFAVASDSVPQPNGLSYMVSSHNRLPLTTPDTASPPSYPSQVVALEAAPSPEGQNALGSGAPYPIADPPLVSTTDIDGQPTAHLAAHQLPPRRTRQPHEQLPPATGPERTSKKRGRKPNGEQVKIKPYEKNPKRGTAHLTPDEMARLDAECLEQAPVPEIKVEYQTVKDARTDMARLYGGGGPRTAMEGQEIAVTLPKGAQHLRLQEPPIIADKGSFYDCHWGDCNRRVPSTDQHIKAHMYSAHGLRLSDRSKIKCRWRPALRVSFPNEPSPRLISNHSLSYECGEVFLLTSIRNHVGTHLYREHQPSPDAGPCFYHNPPLSVVKRGTHRLCPDKANAAGQEAATRREAVWGAARPRDDARREGKEAEEKEEEETNEIRGSRKQRISAMVSSSKVASLSSWSCDDPRPLNKQEQAGCSEAVIAGGKPDQSRNARKPFRHHSTFPSATKRSVRYKQRGMSSSLFARLASRTRNSFPVQRGLRFSSRTRATEQGTRSWISPSFTTLSAAAAISLGAYTIGVIYPPTTLSLLFPRPAPGPPADPTSPDSVAYMEALQSELQNLPFLQKLREADDANEWYETHPYRNYPEERRVNSLTAGTLRGPGKLACIPLIRAKKDESASIVILHVGRALCGHDGIVHGGLLATLLDETLARTAIINLPDKVGVTANLALNYRAPTRADQFIVIRTSLVEAKGRKTVVKGRVEDLNGVLLVEADATFVQPRYAKLLNTKQLRESMGEPPASEPILLADGERLKGSKQ